MDRFLRRRSKCGPGAAELGAQTLASAHGLSPSAPLSADFTPLKPAGPRGATCSPRFNSFLSCWGPLEPPGRRAPPEPVPGAESGHRGGGGPAGPASRDQPCSCVDATRTPPGVRVSPAGGAKPPPIEGPPRTFEPSGWPTFSLVILPGHPPHPEPPPLAPALPPAIHGPSVCLPSCWSDARP